MVELYDRGSLLLGAGDARAASGDTDGARAAFLSAADHARRAGRPPQLATAALGLGGTGFEVALFDDQQIALLEEALDALGDDESALRSRISARLSVALSLAGREQRRIALSESAVRLAHQAVMQVQHRLEPCKVAASKSAVQQIAPLAS